MNEKADPPPRGGTTGRRVLLLEPQSQGHHGVYLRWAIEQLAARGHAIAVIASPDAMDTPR